MNIENLTLKEAREIANLFQNQGSKSVMLQNYIGKYVIVRSRNEGINSGFVKALDDTGIVLSDARRIWYHKPKDKTTSWYEGVSVSGLSDDSKISCTVSEKIIIEDYSITSCSEEATLSIRNFKTNEQKF